jgi:hypothetical protein
VWDLALPELGALDLTAWLRLPDAEDPLTFVAQVSAGSAEPLILDLSLTPERPPGLEAARAAMAGRKVYKNALKDLDRAAQRLAEGDPERALDALLKAARALRALDAPDGPADVPQTRRAIAQAIAETARLTVQPGSAP